MPDTNFRSETTAIQNSNPTPDAVQAPMLRAGEYYSAALKQMQSYGCFAPQDAERSGRGYPLLILLHGLSGNRQDWPQYTRIARYLTGHELIVVFPDGGDGWYTNGVDHGERREDDILQDLLPHLESTWPLLPGTRRAIDGLSMGGYGAVKLALKYPEQFRIGVSHSGALDVASRPGVHPVFGDSQTHRTFRHQENLFWLAEQALCRMPQQRPHLLLDCGASDDLLEENRRFSQHLDFLGYGHTYREMPGHHTWPYWDRAFRTALPHILRLLGLDAPAPANGLAHPNAPDADSGTAANETNRERTRTIVGI